MKSRDIEKIKVDFIEQMVRSVVDTTVSKVVLKPKHNKVDSEWKRVIDLINKNNDIEKLLKYDVRQKSKHGKSYVGFDIFDQEPIIWVANYNPRNQALRLNGQQQFAVRVVREYSSIPEATPILRNEVTYTKKDSTYLFLGGFGLSESYQVSTMEESEKLHKSINPARFPWGYTSLETPRYILEQNKIGRNVHNFEVIPAMEMLNKEVSDYGYDNYLSDWYPAKDYIPLISEYVKFIAWEMNLDHTRVIGMFSMQDLQNITTDSTLISKSSSPKDKLEEVIKKYAVDNIYDTLSMSGEDKAINKKLIIRTIGGEGNNVSVMNSKFDGLKQFQGLQQLIGLVYKICGYSWTTNDGSGQYENISQTQSSQRSVYETTKEKVELFTRQWRELFIKIFYVFFDKKKELVDIEKEFEENVHFEIVSNILINNQNDWRKYLELKNSGLISTERAIKLIWPELAADELEKEIEELNKAEEEKMNLKETDKYNAFHNRKPFGGNEYNKPDVKQENQKDK